MTAILDASVDVALAPTVWVDVCAYDDLVADRGVCALVGERQVAIFRVSPRDELFAVSNHDPFSRANVMSRGIVGSKGEVPKVASPMYKNAFDLRSGQSLDDPAVALAVYLVRRNGRRVEVALP